MSTSAREMFYFALKFYFQFHFSLLSAAFAMLFLLAFFHILRSKTLPGKDHV